jgi:hypothetical protein
MPAIIVFSPSNDTEVHISDLSKEQAAKKIADRFEGFSTDGETTSVVPHDNDELPDGTCLTVVMTNDQADDGSGPDHDLAYVLDFNPRNMRWALKQVCDDPNGHLREAGVLEALEPNVTSYNLVVKYDGCDSVAYGLITFDGSEHHIDLVSGGREMRWAIDEQHVKPSHPLYHFLENWTTPVDAVAEECRRHELDPEDGYNARVENGKVLWLIVDNVVVIGTLVADASR